MHTGLPRRLRTLAAVTATSALLLSACTDEESTDAQGSASSAATAASTTESSSAETASEGKVVRDGETKIVESNKKSSLSDWEGSWESISAHFDDPEIKAGMEDHAKDEGKDFDEMLSEYEKDRGTEFDGLVIDQDNITIVPKLDELSNPSEAPIGYEQAGAYDVTTNDFSFTWFLYEAKDESAPYKYLLLMPPHGEELLVHFHMRYGNDIDELLDAEDWFPILIEQDSADSDLIQEELFEHDH